MDCIIPFGVSELGAKKRIKVYDALRDTAEKYSSLFGGDPFGGEALRWLDAALAPRCEEWGYTPAHGLGGSFVYAVDNVSCIKSGLIMSQTRKVGKNEPLDNLTGTPVDASGGEWDNYEYSAFGTVLDGKIVSICSENTRFLPRGETEVGIETAESWRGRGFAVSNLAALCVYLMTERKIKKVWYECACSNLASRKTAEAAGLKLFGRKFHYIAYKK